METFPDMPETPGYAAVVNSTVAVVVADEEVHVVKMALEPLKFRTIKEAINAEKPYADIKAIIHSL